MQINIKKLALTSIGGVHVEVVLSIEDCSLQTDALALHLAGVRLELGHDVALRSAHLRHRLHHHLRLFAR